MTHIVQLKNDNDEKIYPVTTGEAVRMRGDKTLDQAFDEAKRTLDGEYDSKVQEFGVVYTEKKDALQSDYNRLSAGLNSVEKAGFYRGDNDNNIDYPIGSIVLARSKFGIIGLNSTAFGVYIDSMQGFVVTSPSSTSVLSPGYRKLNGTWSMHGFFNDSSISDPIMLMQRVS